VNFQDVLYLKGFAVLQKQQQVSKEGMPSKSESAVARQLFMKFCAEKNIAFNATNSCYLQAYAAFVSGCRYKAPTTHCLLQALTVDAKTLKLLHDTSLLAVCADKWTGKHVTAATGGPVTTSLFLSSFESNKPAAAEVVATAIHKCVIDSMGVKLCP
jgi:hypothetical protein